MPSFQKMSLNCSAALSPVGSWGGRGSFLVPLLALPLLVAGCQKKTPPPQMPPQPVDVVTLKTQPVTLETSLPGRTDAYEQAQIRPQVNGVIVSRDFEQGADVKAGQQLFQIYIAPYQAAYDQAKAQLLNAQAVAERANGQLKRYRPLVAAHAVSSQDFDNTLATAREAEAQVAQAKAALEAAAVNLNYTHVRAPISGRIGRTLYTAGALLTAGQTQPVAVVTRLDPIYVDVNLAATDMLRLKRELADGQLERNGADAAAVGLKLEDNSEYPLRGKLQLSEVTVDPATGTLVMRAVFPNPDHLLLPGMFVNAHIEEGIDPHGLLVPQVAVARDAKGNPYVMVVDGENKVSQRSIQVLRTVGESWLVSDGLKAGEKVIVSGLQKVQPGAKVSPHEAPPAAPAGKAE
ncbi:efflux RND transporter periplasmic adaptor subunit [Gluconobacter kondonii]|mgnify:FL=1|uniref:efflux RND transporter periplasmic adaptor subunit n=1 Tax=Gluconobacter kondonii TaxID=941463 RepID=UPI00197CE548|nr:efflux RND transporter periplasmic adaptor subunit [Gluconobacter kondonii]MBN3866978.1 efflux RND transporter periplasmic adaptor subunit [Gluconobacter kondonii]MBS1052524.1 efflux RND transporter periplasmic adaptor subunit [Gluconobacter kondonii]MBS1077736.1 efflux RND transporter periplasmic adaptor subunit [Gluconobacter kondonii]